MKQTHNLARSRLPAFTLVELIVVIVIIAILSTIGYISILGYGSKARDSARFSDMNAIVRVLELSYLKNDAYPETGSGIDISYSGSTLWTQGFFDESVQREVRRISEVPLDPIVGVPFVYSVTHNKREYQIAGALESGEALAVVPQASANFSKAVVKGNYNGAILGKKIDGRVHIFGIPSLITKSINSVSIFDIFRDDLFVVNGYGAIPDQLTTIDEVLPKTLGFDSDTPEKILIFSGSLSDLSNQDQLRSVATNIFDLYSDSVLKDFSPIQSYTALDPAGAENIDVILTDISRKIEANNSLSNIVGNSLQALSVTEAEPACSVNYITTIESIGGSDNFAKLAEGVPSRSVSFTDFDGNALSYCMVSLKGPGRSSTEGGACGSKQWGPTYTHIKPIFHSSCPLNSDGNCQYKLIDDITGDPIYETIYTSTGEFIEANVLEKTLPSYLANEYTCNGTTGIFVTGAGPLFVNNLSPDTAMVTLSYSDGYGMKVGGSTIGGPASYTLERSIPAFGSLTVTRFNLAEPQTYTFTSSTFPDFLYQQTIPILKTASQCDKPWGGDYMDSGDTITAYLSSTIAVGDSCSSEVRTCSSGNLSGSYGFESCGIALSPEEECSTAGGSLVSGVCRFNTSSCPSGWSQNGNWAQYKQVSCQTFEVGGCQYYPNVTIGGVWQNGTPTYLNYTYRSSEYNFATYSFSCTKNTNKKCYRSGVIEKIGCVKN